MALKPQKKTPFVAFVKEPSTRDAAKSVASNHGWSESCVHYGDVRQAIVYLKEQPAPHTLLIEIPSAEEAPELLDRLADVCTPDMKVIVTGGVDEFSFFSWLKSIGIEHYLLQPVDAKTLDATLSLKSKQELAEPTDSKLIAVIGARGGVGATTVATNLAYILSHNHHLKTAFLDVDAYFGSAAFTFDITPNHGLRDALNKPDRIDGLFLERVMENVSDHLSILSAEESFEEMLSSSASAAEALVSELNENFAFTIVDLPNSLSSLTRSILAQADEIIIVAECSLLSLRDYLRLRDYIVKILAKNKPKLVLNRIGLAAEHEVTRKDFAKNAETEPDIVLPFTRDAFMANTSGEMLVDCTKNQSIIDGYQNLTALFTDSKPNDNPAKKRGLIGKLLGKGD